MAFEVDTPISTLTMPTEIYELNADTWQRAVDGIEAEHDSEAETTAASDALRMCERQRWLKSVAADVDETAARADAGVDGPLRHPRVPPYPPGQNPHPTCPPGQGQGHQS